MALVLGAAAAAAACSVVLRPLTSASSYICVLLHLRPLTYASSYKCVFLHMRPLTYASSYICILLSMRASANMRARTCCARINFERGGGYVERYRRVTECFFFLFLFFGSPPLNVVFPSSRTEGDLNAALQRWTSLGLQVTPRTTNPKTLNT